IYRFIRRYDQRITQPWCEEPGKNQYGYCYEGKHCDDTQRLGLLEFFLQYAVALGVFATALVFGLRRQSYYTFSSDPGRSSAGAADLRRVRTHAHPQSPVVAAIPDSKGSQCFAASAKASAMTCSPNLSTSTDKIRKRTIRPAK